jgi:hypothetical protein
VAPPLVNVDLVGREVITADTGIRARTKAAIADGDTLKVQLVLARSLLVVVDDSLGKGGDVDAGVRLPGQICDTEKAEQLKKKKKDTPREQKPWQGNGLTEVVILVLWVEIEESDERIQVILRSRSVVVDQAVVGVGIGKAHTSGLLEIEAIGDCNARASKGTKLV